LLPASTLARCALLALLALLPACGDSPGPLPVEPDEPTTPADPPVYRALPPEGTLPWPHHDPDWGPQQYDAMMRDLWVVNNFGLYQGADPGALYLHDALDVVLPNGTPIFAIEPGIVRANIGGDEYYRTLLIEDLERPGWGWGYTHIFNFTVFTGDTVHQGTRIGSVNFRGLEHIHLNRVQRVEGGRWHSYLDLVTVQPDPYFAFVDTEAPVFEGRFRYVRAGTDSAFLATGPDDPVVVSGDVGIVVGLRDPGEWSRSPSPYAGPTPYGDRNSPSRVEYDIAGPDGIIVSAVAFDFSRLRLNRPSSQSERAAQVLALYQFYDYVDPPAPPPGNHNRKFNYYRITSTDGTDGDWELDPARLRHAWRTAETGPDGTARFPDGEYTITVRAFDSKGNMASRTETVRVVNP
jgi:hypothetical protein